MNAYTICHIAQKADWELAQITGRYLVESLKMEGFIHCSGPEQVLATANRYFLGASGLLLLWIDIGRVRPEIKWDPVGEQRFPHIYGPLNLDAVISVQDFMPNEEGIFTELPGG